VKKYTYQIWLLLCAFCLFIGMGPTGWVAAASGSIAWGPAQTGIYESPSIYTLNWSGNVLDKGGLSLLTLKMTNQTREADMVIDYKGTIGAKGIIRLDGESLDSVTTLSGKSFSNTQSIVANAIYLLEMHNGKYAKLRIDRYNEDASGSISKVFFTFVLEEEAERLEEAPASPTPNPTAQPQPSSKPAPTPTSKPTQAPSPSLTPRPQPTPANGGTVQGLDHPMKDLADAGYVYEVEEGPINVPWKGSTSGSRFDLYRSDNGAKYVKMNDFSLNKPEFTDHYAFAGHSYVYRMVSYSADGKAAYSPPVKMVVKEKSMENKQTIELTLDSLKAKINGQERILDTAPTLVNNRTMVPLRFIGEALGAEVTWNGEDRSVSMKLDEKHVRLQIDNSEATVNGNKVMMDVPAQIINDTTMVPVRFVSESLGQEILFDSETRKITILGNSAQGKGDDPVEEQLKEEPKEQPIEQPKEEPKEEPKIDPNDPAAFYIGTWDLFVPGYGGDTPGSFTPGKAGGKLIVKPDYTWQYTLGSNVTTGQWSKIDKSSEILFSKFQYGSDWQGRNKNGRFQIYTFGMYFEATKIN
jgi:hypothetical protein